MPFPWRRKPEKSPEGRYVRLPDDFPAAVGDDVVLSLIEIGRDTITTARMDSETDTAVVEFNFDGKYVKYRVRPVGGVFKQVRP